MYIRRKVFSVVMDEATGEQKLFSTNEIISEEAYLQKVYAEAEEEEQEKASKKAKAKKIAKEAAIVGGTGAGLAAGGVGAYYGTKALAGMKDGGKVKNAIKSGAGKVVEFASKHPKTTAGIAVAAPVVAAGTVAGVRAYKRKKAAKKAAESAE